MEKNKKKFKQKMDLKVQIEKGYKSPNRKEKQNSYSLDKGNKNPNKKEIEKSNGQWTMDIKFQLKKRNKGLSR